MEPLIEPGRGNRGRRLIKKMGSRAALLYEFSLACLVHHRRAQGKTFNEIAQEFSSRDIRSFRGQDLTPNRLGQIAGRYESAEWDEGVLEALCQMQYGGTR